MVHFEWLVATPEDGRMFDERAGGWAIEDA